MQIVSVMRELEPAIAVDGIKQFLKLHLGCGGAWYDTPDLPGRAGYRAMAACRCGDSVEYWLTGAVMSPRRFLEAAAAPVKAVPARAWWTPARKAA